jgi:hypothetical protein
MLGAAKSVEDQQTQTTLMSTNEEMTAEEFFALGSQGKRTELIDGQLVIREHRSRSRRRVCIA